MSRPSFRIVCCLCGRPIPLSQDIYGLDAEWQRRFPAMTGMLACARCALRTHYWICDKPGGGYVDGHIPAVDIEGTRKSRDRDHDSWCHVGPSGTHVAMVIEYPESGLIQGAEEYLRQVTQRRGVDPEVAQRLRTVLGE